MPINIFTIKFKSHKYLQISFQSVIFNYAQLSCLVSAFTYSNVSQDHSQNTTMIYSKYPQFNSKLLVAAMILSLIVCIHIIAPIPSSLSIASARLGNTATPR